MIVLIGMLVGVWDLGSIILIFLVNATMNLFGIMMEYHNQHTEKTNWTSFIFGSIAGIIPWVVIMTYFLSAVSSAEADPPLDLFMPLHDPICFLQYICGQNSSAT